MHKIVVTAALAALALTNPAVAAIMDELDDANLLVQEDELHDYNGGDWLDEELRMIGHMYPPMMDAEILPGLYERLFHEVDYDPSLIVQIGVMWGTGPLLERPLPIFGFT